MEAEAKFLPEDTKRCGLCQKRGECRLLTGRKMGLEQRGRRVVLTLRCNTECRKLGWLAVAFCETTVQIHYVPRAAKQEVYEPPCKTDILRLRSNRSSPELPP